MLICSKTDVEEWEKKGKNGRNESGYLRKLKRGAGEIEAGRDGWDAERGKSRGK